MTDGKTKQEKRAHSPMGAVALLHAWLTFRVRLDPDQVATLMDQVIELLGACNKRCEMLGWIDEDDAPDTERNN